MRFAERDDVNPSLGGSILNEAVAEERDPHHSTTFSHITHRPTGTHSQMTTITPHALNSYLEYDSEGACTISWKATSTPFLPMTVAQATA